MRSAYFECRRSGKRRFYRISAQEGLFGPVLIREWGRIGQPGRCITRPCKTQRDLDTLWVQIKKCRLHRGYELCRENETTEE